MRKKAIHAGILASVFVVAMILFGYAVNRNHIDLTADIGNAFYFRELLIVYNSYKINTLVGYTSELEMATLRDQITPVIDGKVQMQIPGKRQGSSICGLRGLFYRWKEKDVFTGSGTVGG